MRASRANEENRENVLQDLWEERSKREQVVDQSNESLFGFSFTKTRRRTTFTGGFSTVHR
jgi:hypothetical protein